MPIFLQNPQHSKEDIFLNNGSGDSHFVKYEYFNNNVCFYIANNQMINEMFMISCNIRLLKISIKVHTTFFVVGIEFCTSNWIKEIAILKTFLIGNLQ